MNYVINPWVFYLINVLDKISEIIILILIFGIIIDITALISLAIFSGISENKKEEESISKLKKICEKASIIIVISMILYILIPSKESCKEMIVANFVTYDNIEYSKEELKETIDYICEKINNTNQSNDK